MYDILYILYILSYLILCYVMLYYIIFTMSYPLLGVSFRSSMARDHCESTSETHRCTRHEGNVPAKRDAQMSQGHQKSLLPFLKYII